MSAARAHRQAGRVEADPQREGSQVDRPERDVHRQLDVEGGRTLEVDALLRRVAELDRELRLQSLAAEDRRQEAVRAAEVDDELAAGQLAADGEPAHRLVGGDVPAQGDAGAGRELRRLDVARRALTQQQERAAVGVLAQPRRRERPLDAAGRRLHRDRVVGAEQDRRARIEIAGRGDRHRGRHRQLLTQRHLGRDREGQRAPGSDRLVA